MLAARRGGSRGGSASGSCIARMTGALRVFFLPFLLAAPPAVALLVCILMAPAHCGLDLVMAGCITNALGVLLAFVGCFHPQFLLLRAVGAAQRRPPLESAPAPAPAPEAEVEPVCPPGCGFYSLLLTSGVVCCVMGGIIHEGRQCLPTVGWVLLIPAPCALALSVLYYTRYCIAAIEAHVDSTLEREAEREPSSVLTVTLRVLQMDAALGGCSICYDSLGGPTTASLEAACERGAEERSVIVCMPCHEKHIFHLSCIREWLGRNFSCPLCRQSCHRMPEDV